MHVSLIPVNVSTIILSFIDIVKCVPFYCCILLHWSPLTVLPTGLVTPSFPAWVHHSLLKYTVIRAVSRFWLLEIKLLWTFMLKSFYYAFIYLSQNGLDKSYSWCLFNFSKKLSTSFPSLLICFQFLSAVYPSSSYSTPMQIFAVLMWFYLF